MQTPELAEEAMSDIFIQDNEKKLKARIKMESAKKLLAYQEKVRDDRREQFEQWDENSKALIKQYEKEMADAKAELEA